MVSAETTPLLEGYKGKNGKTSCFSPMPGCVWYLMFTERNQLTARKKIKKERSDDKYEMIDKSPAVAMDLKKYRHGDTQATYLST